MRNSFLMMVVAASVLMPCAAIAGDNATQNSSSTAAVNTATDPSTDENQMVCRREKLTGTLLPGPRVCKSLKVWRQQQQNSKDILNDLTTRNLQANPKGG